MNYLCLIYTDEAQTRTISSNEHDSMMAEYMSFTSDIIKSGHYISGNRLESVNAATTVRVRDGRLSTTDGPFAETKEQLGGYFLLEARDLNEALQIAARIPGARVGCIEVRPISVTPEPKLD